MNPDQIRSYVEAAFRAHEHKLRSFIRRKLNAQSAWTEDVLSVTFQRLLTRIEKAIEQEKYDYFFLRIAQMELPNSQRTASALRQIATFVISDLFRNLANEPQMPNPVPDPEEEGELIELEIVDPGTDSDQLTSGEASATYQRILDELFRQTTRAFEKAVLIGMAYDIDDDEIAARFGRHRKHVQRARHLLKKRAKEIASRMLED